MNAYESRCGGRWEGPCDGAREGAWSGPCRGACEGPSGGAFDGPSEEPCGARDACVFFRESGQMLANNSESGQMLVNDRHLGTDSFALLTSRGASRAWMLVIYKQTGPRLVRLVLF